MRFILTIVLIVLFLALAGVRPAQAEAPVLSPALSIDQAQALLTDVSQNYGTYLGDKSDDQVRAVAEIVSRGAGWPGFVV